MTRRATLHLKPRRQLPELKDGEDPLAEALAAGVQPAPAALPKQRGKYAWEEFGASRSLAVATDNDLLAELRRRRERDPAFAEISRLILDFVVSPPVTEPGFLSGVPAVPPTDKETA